MNKPGAADGPAAPQASAANGGRAAYEKLRRRDVLRQGAKAAALAAGAGYLALAPAGWPLSLNDPDGERGKPQPERLTLPEGGYRVAPPASAAYLGIAHGQRVDAMVRAAIDAIGGIRHYIARGDVVVIKPNVAFERAAALGATTHPDILRALILLAREAGASEVRVADNPIESPESCFARTGLQRAAVDAGARVYLPAPSDFRVLETQGATHIARWPFFYRPFAGATKVIGVAPVKDHNLCRASMTTKNWYGLLGGRRNQFHQDIHGIISDLALMLRPTFVVLDATRVLFRSGPTGGSLADVKQGHTIVASADSLATDAFGWDELLERRDEPLPDYFRQVEARGLGRSQWKQVARKEVRVG